MIAIAFASCGGMDNMTVMIFSTLLFMQVASNPLPQPLTETHMRDIGCIATLGLVASDQRKGMAPSLRFPNVMERGATYARIIGERIVAETGQRKEIIGLAIGQAVEDQQERAIAADASGGDAKALFARLMSKCLPLLDAEVPEKAPTPDEYRFCAAIISLSADEIEGREGKESVNAKAMRGLAAQLVQKYSDARLAAAKARSTSLSKSDVVSTNATAARIEIDNEIKNQLELAAKTGGLEAMTEAEGEAKFQRCIFLGE